MKNIFCVAFYLNLFYVSVFASIPISIDENISTRIVFGSIYEDKSAKLTVDEVLTKNLFIPNMSTSAKGTKSAIWTKSEFENKTTQDIEVVFKNERPGIDFLDIFVYEDDVLVQKYLLGDMREQSLRDIVYRYSAFPITLKSGKRYTVATKLVSVGAFYTAWNVMSKKYFTYRDTMDSMLWGLFGGIIAALVIYILFMFISFREVAFIMYIIYAIASLWFQYALSGVLYGLDIGINLEFITYSTWIVPNLGLGALALFPLFFFKLYKNHKKISAVLILFAVVSFGISIMFSFAFWDISVLRHSIYTVPFSLLLLIFLFGLGLYAYKNHFAGSGYYLLGQGGYLIFLVYNTWVMMGYIQTSAYSYLAIPVGIYFDIIFLSLALSQKIKFIQLQNEINSKLLMEQAKFSSIGQAIGNVAHQWKTPISHLSTQIMFLEGILTVQKDQLQNKFKEVLPQIKDSIEYMKDSVNEFYDFYSGGNEKVEFSFANEIAIALKILHSQIILQNITIFVRVDKHLVCNSYKNSFLNIVMILVENAIHELTSKNIKDGEIKITVDKIENKIILIVCDNGGGISVKPIEKIFEPHCSTKNLQGCGLGLSIAKMIVEEKFSGKLVATNLKTGVEFKAILTLDIC